MKRDVVEALNACRGEILSSGSRGDVAAIERCVVPRLTPFRDMPHVRALLDTLAAGSLDSSRLLDLTFSDDPTFVLGFFDVPYNPDSFLEAAALAPVRIPERVLAVAPEGNAMPVRIAHCTDGFRDPLAVAVFGENYIGAEVKDHHKAYYFVDKFVARFKAHTRTAIAGHWSPTAFPHLLDADDDLLVQASAIWVHMHEYFHRTGFLPIPKHLKEKSSRNGAGAEELRVDVLSILALARMPDLDPTLETAIQYMLAERLIRYPMQAAPHDNYDARSSVALFNYLVRHGVVARQGGVLYFEGGFPRLRQALESLSTKIASLECRLTEEECEADRKAALADILPALAQNDNKWPREQIRSPEELAS